MIRLFINNGSTRRGVVIPSLFLFFVNLLFFSSPAGSVPSRLPETTYDRQDLFPEKIFLDIDNGLITLIARNSHLGLILDEISRKSGVKINVSPIFRSKRVTVNSKDVPLKECIKKIAEDSGLLFEKDKVGNLDLSEVHVVPQSEGKYIKMNEKETQTIASNDITQTKQAIIRPKRSVSPETGFSQNKDINKNIGLHEIVIRFKADISEKDINKFLSDANIKVKKYIAALHYHILSLPDGMTYYDAIVLLQSKKMLYQAEPKYLVPLK